MSSAFIYLFRHGRAAPCGILAGRTDYPLTRLGEKQAWYWRERLQGVTFVKAWQSPLTRSRQTASIILGGNPANPERARTVAPLCEISLGVWDGMYKDGVKRRYPELWEARGKDLVYTAPPEGENFSRLAARVLPAFAALMRRVPATGACLIAGHQAVNRVILAHLLAVPLNKVLGIAQPDACLNLLELRPGKAPMLVEQRFVPSELYSDSGK